MQRDRKATLLIALIVLLVLQTATVLWIGTPMPVPENDERFSSDAAFATLTELVQNEQPRPTRSKANVNFRTRLVAHLEALGYAPTVQTAMMRPFVVHNVFAELQGTAGPDAPLILLVAHHDSVHGSPGAADDGSGVATLLETARLWKLRAAPHNSVGFLFTDGEESGLLGARLFVQQHPALARVAVVLNFEARGVRGPSSMFETFGGDKDLISIYGKVVERPFASSVFAFAYSLMPNDTDLTVFGEAGKKGMNFAFIEGAEHYHQPSDTLANLSRGSLQHHGDQAWPLSVALAEQDTSTWSDSNAVYFDVLQMFLVSWPAGLTPWLGALALLLLLFARTRFRAPPLSITRRIAAELSLPALIVLGYFVGDLVARGWTASGLVTTWFPEPLWLITLSYWLGTGCVLAVVGGFWIRGQGTVQVQIEVYARLAVIGLVLAFLAPGVSYLLIVPALTAACVSFPALRVRNSALLTTLQLVPLVVAGLLWLPLLDRLPVALGALSGTVIGAAQGLFVAFLLPLWAGVSVRTASVLDRDLTVATE